MVSMLLASSLALAQSVSVGPSVGVVGDPSIFVRPGLRVGFEPSPSAALELLGDVNPVGTHWDGGLGLVGRLWLGNSVASDGEGLFLMGRFVAGMSGEYGKVGPWTGIFAGFGGRPVPAINLEASFGPEWTLPAGARWRTDLSVSFVIDTQGGGGGGTVRHHPRKIR